MLTPSTPLPQRRLGESGISVSAIGFGCMSLSGAYGPSDDDEAARLIDHALDAGITLFNSADAYGAGHNETLLGKAMAGRRNRFVIATKFGNVRRADGPGADGRPEYARSSCEASLKRLGIDTIDLYYVHRIDPAVPIEDTVGEMARLVEQGKIRAIGLSEARPETIRRAHKIHPVSAVQTEYSVLYRTEAEETLATTRELGISFVAYSPLGRGLLTGAIDQTLPEDDGRRRHPRFAGDNLGRNLSLIVPLEAMARDKRCTTAQLVLAWLLARGSDIVPIPGTKQIARLDDNIGALEVKLSADEIARITAAVPAGAASGTRYPEGQMKSVFL